MSGKIDYQPFGEGWKEYVMSMPIREIELIFNVHQKTGERKESFVDRIAKLKGGV